MGDYLYRPRYLPTKAGTDGFWRLGLSQILRTLDPCLEATGEHLPHWDHASEGPAGGTGRKE